MTAPIITVDRISKLYHIGQREQINKTFREALIETVSAPVRNFRDIWNLTRFDPTGKNAQDSADTIWALREVSFDVHPGQVIGIIGSNGSGKSTLLKILSRITEPTSGEAWLYGRISSLLEVGTGFHPELTGRENIYLNGSLLGMRKAEIERKFDEIVAFAEVDKFIDTPVKRYSSGMYVRLAFAVAANLEPEILLVDEVLAVGDIAFQKKCLGKMGEVARSGRTILFVSHNMAAVRKLCSHSILLKNGKISCNGPTEDVINAYLSSRSLEGDNSIDLPAADPDSPGHGLMLRFYSLDHQPKTTIKIGEKWIIHLEFQINRRTEHVIAGIGLITTDEIPITTFWSKPQDLAPGKYRVEFTCDLPLKKMTIQFAVGISSYERSFYYADCQGLITISEISQDDQPVRSSSAGILMNYQHSEIQRINGE